MRKLSHFSIVLAVFFLFNACDTPLSEYEPKNDDEKSILKLLNTYVDARNNGDIDKLASLFHDNAMYRSGMGATFTKTQIAQSKPEVWVQLGKLRLLNSEFTINGNEAEVSSTGKWGSGLGAAPYPHISTLVKEDGNWLFMRIKTGN